MMYPLWYMVFWDQGIFLNINVFDDPECQKVLVEFLDAEHKGDMGKINVDEGTGLL